MCVCVCGVNVCVYMWSKCVNLLMWSKCVNPVIGLTVTAHYTQNLHSSTQAVVVPTQVAVVCLLDLPRGRSPSICLHMFGS